MIRTLGSLFARCSDSPAATRQCPEIPGSLEGSRPGSQSRRLKGCRSTFRQGARSLVLGVLGVLIGLIASPNTVFADDASFVLDSRVAVGSAASIPLGDDLWVRAEGLSGFEAIRFELRDETGLLWNRAETNTDASGSSPAISLWKRTGIAGCDIGVPLTIPTPFSTRAAAFAALDGRSFEMRLVRLIDSKVLSRRDLGIALPSTYRVHFSDSNGCFRAFFDPGEPVFASFWGPTPPSDALVFLAADRPRWVAGDVQFEDVRGNGSTVPTPVSNPASAKSTGNSIGPVFTHEIWGFGESVDGYYAAIVRPSASGGTTKQLLSGDALLAYQAAQDNKPGTNDEGIVIGGGWGIGIVIED